MVESATATATACTSSVTIHQQAHTYKQTKHSDEVVRGTGHQTRHRTHSHHSQGRCTKVGPDPYTIHLPCTFLPALTLNMA